MKYGFYRTCLRCDDFLTTNDLKVKHDFLKHYSTGHDTPYEDKPIDIEKFGRLTRYSISHQKLKDAYMSLKILKQWLMTF